MTEHRARISSTVDQVCGLKPNLALKVSTDNHGHNLLHHNFTVLVVVLS